MQQLKNLPKISDDSIRYLKKGKNLLAFSGGIDSSSLFYILGAYQIDFDLIIVDYNTREQSKKEVAYAKELSKKYNKTLYLKSTNIKSSNFEHTARIVRYDFFEEIINKHGYNYLITAHQLNDKLEWFFMQLSKGAGLVELLGFDEVRIRKNYTLVRPLIENSKDELLDFLKKNSLQYFIDESNKNEKYKRNYIRKNFSNKFLNEYKTGIINSFKYLQKDKKTIFELKDIKKIKNLYIFRDNFDELKNIRTIDAVLKELGYVLSKSQRDEILKNKSVVISDRFVVTFANNNIYISPFCKIKLDKNFKESCRIKKIPPKIRTYIKKEDIDLLLI